MNKLLTIREVNALRYAEFVEVFSNIVECCPETANAIWNDIPFSSIDDIVTSACHYIDQLSTEGKEQVLMLHPDLGGRLATEGKLTEESAREQKAADLHSLSSANKIRMGQLNSSYREKFGFPFVICARENKAVAIMQGLESRLQNSKNMELDTGIDEVKKICRLRIIELVEK